VVLLVARLDGRATKLIGSSCQLHSSLLWLLVSFIPLRVLDIHTWGIRTRSPTATLMAMRLPSRSRPPGPTARTLASLSFSTLDSGRKMPLAVLASALTRWTRTRSRRGARARMERTVDWGFTLAKCLFNSLHSRFKKLPSQRQWQGVPQQ
jgi:hypothetical protein